MPTETPSLADLVADAKQMKLAMVPSPRSAARPAVDLRETEIRIPDSTRSLVDGLETYGA